MWLRDYFLSKYWLNYKTKYISKAKELDLILLRTLLDKYGEDVVLFAIDSFFHDVPQEKASINYFSNIPFFESKYSLLIKAGKMLKYKRILNTLSIESKPIAEELIKEYVDYSNAMFLSREEITRKQEILDELEKLCKKT